jgi:hypothetical protein
MQIINKLLNTKFAKAFLGQDGENQKTVRAKQIKMLIFLVIAVFASWTLFEEIYKKVTKDEKKEKQKMEKEEIRIRTAGEVLNQDDLWAKYFEKRLLEHETKRNKEHHELLSKIDSKYQEIIDKQAVDIEELRSDLDYKNRHLKDMILNKQEGEYSLKIDTEGNVSILPVGSSFKDLPKDIGLYVPAGTTARGRMLGGISVPTGVDVQSDPFPVIMVITDYANTPNEEKIDLRKCRIIGSCYGNISNERAIIRLETLSCVDKKTKRAVETKIAGTVFGGDGLPNIKGRVVSMDSKHMKNAVIGGFLSGFSKATRDQSDSGLSGLLGGGSPKKKKFKDKMEDHSIAGIGDTSEKIANYFIKKAESIQEVIEVPAGALVDITFTQGIYLGSVDVKKEIETVRDSKIKPVKFDD